MELFLGSDDEDGPPAGAFALHAAAEAGDEEALRALLAPRKPKGDGREGDDDEQEDGGDDGDGDGENEDADAKPKKDKDFDPEADSGDEEEDDEDLDLNERDDDGCTPLHLALMNGHAGCARLLLEGGAEAFVTLEHSTPLHVAVSSGSLPGNEAFVHDAVAALIEQEALVDATDDFDRTPLHLACMYGLEGAARQLLDAGGAESINAADRAGWTPLHLAAAAGHVGVARALLDPKYGGADVSAADKRGRTPLHAAAVAGADATCRALLEAGADAAAADAQGRTPKQLAAARGHAVPSLGTAAAAGAGPVRPTLVLAPDRCFEHRTARPIVRGGSSPPPENVTRLKVLLDSRTGALRAREFVEPAPDCGAVALELSTRARPAAVVDVLRVHDWPYVKRVEQLCRSLPDLPQVIGNVDGDTAVSAGSFSAALCAAGAVCDAVDAVVSGKSRNAFCVVRPPGHHAGPMGGVTPPGELSPGSQGFCLLSNVAIGAAYARCVHRAAGIRRVALVDFDVHHGNGTQAVVQNCVPSVTKVPIKTPYFDGVVRTPSYKPWLDDTDASEVFFASVHGFDGSFYPGSGATGDTQGYGVGPDEAQEWSEDGVVIGAGELPTPGRDGPRVLNVGMQGRGPRIKRGAAWRRVWKGLVLPQLFEFDPDLIVISAGFDAHVKDDIQGGVNLGVREHDYEWITDELVKVANSCCEGRVVSVLEGGYRVQGGVVSAFSRSVAAHVRALQRPNKERFSPDDLAGELEEEWRVRREERAAAAAARAEMERLAAEREAAEAEAGADAPAGGAEPMVTDAPVPPAVLAPEEGDGDGDGGGSRKRRRGGGAVDYAALNAQLEAEAAAAKQQQQR